MPYFASFMHVITGANGFLGAHLCASLLLEGYKVRACKRETSSLTEFESILSWRLEDKRDLLSNLEWHNADVLDYEALLPAFEGAEAIYHCAAVVSFWPKRREEMMEINVQGTANVVNACLELNIKRLLHVSSIAAIGRSNKGEIITEQTEWSESKNNSQYSISKYQGELEVWRGREEGLEPVIVNPGIILGEGDWNKGSCRFFKMILEGMKYYTGGQNGYVDVLDVCDVLIKLSKSDIIGERFILISENLPVKDFLGLVAEKSGKKAPKKEVKRWMLELAWRTLAIKAKLDGNEPLITEETARTSMNRYTYSGEKIIRETAFKYRTIEECVTRVLRRK